MTIHCVCVRVTEHIDIIVQGCSTNQTAICTAQKALSQRWADSGVASLVEMGTYYGTDLGFNQMLLEQPLRSGVPPSMLSSGIGMAQKNTSPFLRRFLTREKGVHVHTKTGSGQT